MKSSLFNLKQSLAAEARFFAYIKHEDERKAHLGEFFDELEASEKSVKPQVKGERKYSRIFRGLARVGKKQANGVVLYRTSGRRLGVLPLPTEAITLLEIDDDLDIVLGLREGIWRIISVLSVGSFLSPERDPGLN